MNVIKVGFIGLLAAVAVLSVKSYLRKASAVMPPSAEAATGSGGAGARAFREIPLPDGQPGDRVVIFAPANCPSAAAQRADALAQHLDRAGVPYIRSQNAQFGSLASQEEADRVRAVMNGEIPVVFVRTRARANPPAEDVVAEYRAEGMH